MSAKSPSRCRARARVAQLIVGGTILPALVYGAIVVLYLVVRRRLESQEGGFDLGRFELPVAVAALIWVAVAVFVLATPADAFSLIVVGIVASGGLYSAKMMIFNREGARRRAGGRRRRRARGGDDSVTAPGPGLA